MIKKRVEALRNKMRSLGLQAFIIHGMDPHLSEYVSDHWKTRQWISGFTGSAGTVVITHDKALLWTDFRYWIQGAAELKTSVFQLMKEGEPGTPTIAEWLSEELKAGDDVGVNGMEISIAHAQQLSQGLSSSSIELIEVGDLLDELWPDRPLESMDSIEQHPLTLSGKSCKEKLSTIRMELKNTSSQGLLISSLDSIAWLFNMRSTDIPYNPVFRAYAWVSEDQCHLFIEKIRLTVEITAKLNSDGVNIHEYNEFIAFLKTIKVNEILITPHKTPWIIQHYLDPQTLIQGSPAILELQKSQKNKVEIMGFRQIMPHDGKALLQLQMWLQENLGKRELTEGDIARKISEFRCRISDSRGDSFAPIAAYQQNAALCHYETTQDKPVNIGQEGIFLLDSGGQYLRATTDITRCFSLGNPSAQEKRDYTLVLKGHIALSKTTFPRGTRGYQLDVLARKPLWDHGLDYGHGTGHGVGAFLNVHEGPQSISPRPIDQALLPGMILSIEPGLYRQGIRGIRIENLVSVVESNNNHGEGWLEFETLSLYPYERELIEIDLLDKHEIQWINGYHERVLQSMNPLLDEEQSHWLAQRCKAIE